MASPVGTLVAIRAPSAVLARGVALPREPVLQTVRTTNSCERSFVEQRRRAKVLPRFRGEKECLKLVFATLWRSSTRWRNVKFARLERTEQDRYIEARRTDGHNIRSLDYAE